MKEAAESVFRGSLDSEIEKTKTTSKESQKSTKSESKETSRSEDSEELDITESESWSPSEDKDSSEAEENSSKAKNDPKANLDYSLTSEQASQSQSEKPDMPQNSKILHDLNQSQSSSSFFLTEVEDSDKLHFQSSQDNKSSKLRTQNEVVNQVSSSEQVAHQHPKPVGARGAV